MNANVKKVIEVARSWDRKNIHVIEGSPKETCAFFVRYVFKKALHEAGKMPVAYNRPYYAENKIRSLPTNENFADGLAGNEIGSKVPISQMQAGDILLFKDTYFSNEFPVGSITHVGIALDSNGLMADSSGGRCHVRNYRSIPGELVEVRRPICLGIVSKGIGITLSKGQIISSGSCKEIKVTYLKGLMGATSKPNVYVDGKEYQYKYISVDIALAGGNQHIKLFHHDGRTNVFSMGYKVDGISILAKLQGGLHVWSNGNEIKPISVNIGVS